jgi:prophage antirepressor-like protein
MGRTTQAYYIDNDYTVRVVGKDLQTAAFMKDDVVAYIRPGVPPAGPEYVNMDTLQKYTMWLAEHYGGRVQERALKLWRWANQTLPYLLAREQQPSMVYDMASDGPVPFVPPPPPPPVHEPWTPEDDFQKNSTTDLAVPRFEFDGMQVRVVVLEGEPWFVGRDVAGALGYENLSRDIQRHCNHAKTLKGTESEPLTDSPRGVLIIPESDVYRLIMRSNLPEAERFQAWVTEEVLPSIRKTGGYGKTNPGPDSNPFENPETVVQLAVAFRDTCRQLESEKKLRQVEHDGRKRAEDANTILLGDLDELEDELAAVRESLGEEVEKCLREVLGEGTQITPTLFVSTVKLMDPSRPKRKESIGTHILYENWLKWRWLRREPISARAYRYVPQQRYKSYFCMGLNGRLELTIRGAVRTTTKLKAEGFYPAPKDTTTANEFTRLEVVK